MTDFKTYYNSHFREDLDRFFSSVPDESKFHEDTENRKIFSIQYGKLSGENGHLDFLNKEEKEYFGVSLYFTVLTDMVCFSDYKYSKFFAKTRYPKFIGNCLIMCHYHLNPKEIFIAMSNRKKPAEQHLIFIDKFQEPIPTMKSEVIGFFSTHLDEINGIDFWNKCQTEFPYKN